MTGQKHVLDLFSGLGGFSAAFRDDSDYRVTAVDIEERFDPDVQADVLDLRPSDFESVDIVLASPPCTAFSLAASGTHLDGDGRPVSEWGRESLALVHHTVGLIKGLNPDWYAIENPMGGMRKQLGRPDAHVWWCQYGSSRAKPTDLWGRIPDSFDAQRCYNGADDHETAPRGSSTGTQGVADASDRAKIPYELSRALREAIRNPEPRQTTLPTQPGADQ